MSHFCRRAEAFCGFAPTGRMALQRFRPFTQLALSSIAVGGNIDSILIKLATSFHHRFQSIIAIGSIKRNILRGKLLHPGFHIIKVFPHAFSGLAGIFIFNGIHHPAMLFIYVFHFHTFVILAKGFFKYVIYGKHQMRLNSIMSSLGDSDMEIRIVFNYVDTSFDL
jgi:hypothetical protein